MSEFDIILKNINIVDGTGKQKYSADIGVLKGKIEYIGEITDSTADDIIDGYGLVAAPGFIDAHSHSDINVFHDVSRQNKLEQGITSEIAGHCGLTLAPVSDRFFGHLKKYISFLMGSADVPENWGKFTSFGKFLDEAEKMKSGTNLGFLVGQGSVRISVMGFENRRATREELEKMKSLVRDAMESGALGLSSGLIYAPGLYTPKNELIELCKVVHEYGGCYSSHMRNESYDIVNAVDEAIDTGRQSGVPVIISHHKVAGKSNWGKSVETLEKVDKANRDGMDVSLDQYPYNAASTVLSVTMPPWCHEGGTRELLERIKDSRNWDRIKSEIESQSNKWDSFLHNCGYENILTGVDGQKKTLVQYAEEENVRPFEALIDILIKTDASAAAIFIMMNDKDMEDIMKYRNTMVCTDEGMVITGRCNHPRAVGSFPRILARYVREKKVLGLEEAVRKMTSLTAQKYKVKGKGIIRTGFDADLVVFDPVTIMDKAGYTDNLLKNEGLKYVMVNGRIAVKNNIYNGIRAGRIIRML